MRWVPGDTRSLIGALGVDVPTAEMLLDSLLDLDSRDTMRTMGLLIGVVVLRSLPRLANAVHHRRKSKLADLGIPA